MKSDLGDRLRTLIAHLRRMLGLRKPGQLGGRRRQAKHTMYELMRGQH